MTDVGLVMVWVSGDKLTPDQRAVVLSGYTYRMTHENAKRNPVLVGQLMQLQNYELRLLSDDEWLACTLFRVIEGMPRGYCRFTHPDMPHEMLRTAPPPGDFVRTTKRPKQKRK